MADFGQTFKNEQPKGADDGKGINFCCNQIKQNYGPLFFSLYTIYRENVCACNSS